MLVKILITAPYLVGNQKINAQLLLEGDVVDFDETYALECIKSGHVVPVQNLLKEIELSEPQELITVESDIQTDEQTPVLEPENIQETVDVKPIEPKKKSRK